MKDHTTVTRFAPSPTGRLHLGHAYSALFAAHEAETRKGRFLLRIEDIDSTRCKPEFEKGILEDLTWLGLTWEQPVRRQSEHMNEYSRAIATLGDSGLLYPCFCTRAEIKAEIAQAGGAPQGPEGPIYPGTCRDLSVEECQAKIGSGAPFAWRLDMQEAISRTGKLQWHDAEKGYIDAKPGLFGDVVLARREIPTSYHLSVTLDDAKQGVTLVTRGVDLFNATHVHRLLQELLELDTPDYHHHRIIADDTGQRLAKRAASPTIQSLRDTGTSVSEVKRMAGFG